MRQEIQSQFVQRFSRLGPTPTLAVSADDLQGVERELGITFPLAYVTFITQYGPIFTPGVLDLVTGGESEQAPEDASFDVREFFEPGEIIKTHRLYASGGMEDWLVPFAMDSMGNVFGFKREKHQTRPDDGPVSFFDHDYCKIHQEAEAFDAWLNSFLDLAR